MIFSLSRAPMPIDQKCRDLLGGRHGHIAKLSRGFHALAASTAAIGFAQVARIKSTNPGSGGSRPSLGGGSAAKASTQTGGTAASSGPSQSVFINVQGKSRFTVDEVNDLMEQLIERQRDGAQLVLVR
jgi:hypothetical protein